MSAPAPPSCCAALPADTLGEGRRPRACADAGYFTAELALAADQAGCDYAIAAKRNTAAWRAYAAIPDDAWADANDMPGAQIAAADYRPEGWPPDAYTIVRRVRVQSADISHDGRSRRRRTIPADQLTLALQGNLDHVHAVSFIITNIPTGGTNSHGENFDSLVDVEACFRGRVDIEDRIREAKLGAALRHLPSGHQAVNAVWMWAAFTALNLSALLQALTGLDRNGPRTANGYAANCSASPPASSTTHAASNSDYPQDHTYCPTPWPGYENSPPPNHTVTATPLTRLGHHRTRTGLQPLPSNTHTPDTMIINRSEDQHGSYSRIRVRAIR